MLTIISKDNERSNGRNNYYFCQCDCKSPLKSIQICNILNDGTKSCGCKPYKKHKKSLNIYDLTGDFGIGYTLKGKIFYFDLEDYDLIKDYYWTCDRDNYIISNNLIRMHRLVMNCPEEMIVDHIFHNNYDNRKSQLRICTRKENKMNIKVKGVSYNKKTKKWFARICLNKEKFYLGSYETEEEALQARINAEKELFGEFAIERNLK